MKTQDPSGSDPRAGTDRMIQPAARKRRRWLLAAGFLTITTVALAATLVISGEFTSTKIVSGYDVYDATDATAYVQQGINNTGFRVTSSPNNADWIGGTVIGQGHNKTLSWRDLYDQGNGAGFLIQSSNNFTVDGMYAEWSWDGIRPAGGASGNILIRRVWLNNWRDDGIEADHLGDFNKFRVENSLFEEGHTFSSTRRGGSATGSTPAYRMEWVNNVMSLGLHLEDRAKREYSWSGSVPGTQSGQLFKTEGNGVNCTMLFKNNIVKLVEAPGVTKSRLNLLPGEATIDSNSGGNTLVWLGGSPSGLEMETIDGVKVPVDFDIDPAIWDVTSNETTWNNARTNWINNVWNGGGTDTQAPTVDVTAPTNGATVSGTIAVTASASDNVGVAGVQFKVDGANLGTEDTAAPYSRNWDTTGATNASHTITAVARDAAANSTTSSNVTVTVDNSGGGTGTTLEFNPTEDTHIRQGQPDATWGSYSYMRVRALSGTQCFGVLKFNVTGVSGTVTGVKLRMHTQDTAMSDTTAYQVTGSWSEGSLTWNNSSLNWGSSLGSVSNVNANAWYEINLGTSYITGDGTYSIGIKTTDTANNQDWESSESGNPPVLIVTIDDGTGGNPPGQASSPSPANAASGVDVNADLSWTAGSGAASHDVYFGTDSTPDPGEFKGNQTSASFDPGTLANNTTYYWRIDEKNANGTTTGTVWSFTTAVSLPGQATSPSPANSGTGVTVATDLSWTAGSGATSHDVYFGTDSTPDAGEFRGNQTGTTFDPGELLGNTTYHWRIDEVNSAGKTTGTVWSFTTAAEAQTLTFNPTEDTHIRQGQPDATWGSHVYMRVRALAGTQCFGVMKFNVTGISGSVIGAKLKLRTQDTGMADTTAYLVTGSWSESTLTWNNSSLNWGAALGTVTGVTANTWHEIILDPGFINGNGTYSIGIKTTSTANNQDWESRDSTNDPVLEITYGAPLIDNLTVNDSANAADWSIQANLQVGNVQYGDRTYAFTTVPAIVRDDPWIRTANDSKSYTGATVASFTVGATADVYVAHNDLITSKPSWLSTWTDTGANLVNDEGTPKTFSLYKKTFTAGSTVNLGPNGDTTKGMYTVIVCPHDCEL